MNACVSFSKHRSLTIMSSWVSNPLPSAHLTYYILSPKSNYLQFHPCHYRLNSYLPSSERLEICLKVFFYFSLPFSSSVPLNKPPTAKFFWKQDIKADGESSKSIYPRFFHVVSWRYRTVFLVMEDLDFQLEGICYQWTNMPLRESLKRIQRSADWIRELCPHKPVLLPQMAQTQRVRDVPVLPARMILLPLVLFLLHFLLWIYMRMRRRRIHSEINFMRWRQTHTRVSSKQLW